MKIVVDVVNGEKVRELTAEIARQEQAIAHWNREMQGANSVQRAYLEGSMHQAAVAIAGANAQLKEIPQSAASAGRGLQQFAYAVDDLQYGFNAIVNNIPQIVMGLGGSVGIAGAIGIAAVAINQLIKHWAEVTSLFEAGFSNQSYDQLVAVKKAAEAAADSYEKLAKAKTQWEDKGGKAAGQAVADAGTAKIRKVIADTLSASPEGAEMTENEKRAAASVINADDKIQEGVMARINKRLQEENLKEAEKILGGLDAGGEVEQRARGKLKHLMDKNPEAFDQVDPGFRKNIEESDPKVIKERKEADDLEKARKKIQDKEDSINAKNWQERRRELEEEKQFKIQGLEDERTKVQLHQKRFDEEMWDQMHEQKAPAQILHGARSATDYYQTGDKGQEQKDLAKQAHAQRERTNKQLESIDAQLKKERRLVVPH